MSPAGGFLRTLHGPSSRATSDARAPEHPRGHGAPPSANLQDSCGLGHVPRRGGRRRAAGAVPQAADQFLNAEAGARGGVTIAIAPSQLSAARVRAALERVLGNAAFRTAAQRAQAEISAMPAPEAVVEELERRYAT
jgi:hypothetical protein